MSKAFEFPLDDGADRDTLIERARNEARGAGIVLQGDTSSGRFSGTAEGTYVINDGVVTVEVTQKPGFIPWQMVETALRKVFT